MKKLVFLAIFFSHFSLASSKFLPNSINVDVDKNSADGKDIKDCRREVDSRGEQLSSTSRTLRQMDLWYLVALMQDPPYSDPRFGADNYQNKKEKETDEDYQERVVRELEARMIFVDRNTKPLSPATIQMMKSIHAEPLDIGDIKLGDFTWHYDDEDSP